MLLVCAFIVGIVAGLRAMMAPAVVSWFARMGVLGVGGTPLAFMGYRYTPFVFSLLALGELVNDKLPKTPSRKTPPQFIGRLLTGGLSGATVGAAGHSLIAGLILGMLGAIAGTLGGAAVRGKLAAAFSKDLPAALLEDVTAIAVAIFSVLELV
ncbi:MAG TPA: hypothetical protein VHD85_15245 [Terracidiphilus sp.]|nr:hypothetical protein [Terracidiphilus sp.]